MHTSKVRFFAVAALAAVALAACSSSSKASNTTSPETTTAPTAAAGGGGDTGTTTVALASSAKYGKILVNDKGMTLYVDEKDKPGKPACTEACLQAWPPVAAPDTFAAGTGVTATKFSSVTLSDGTKQLTVNGSPLYLWMNDKKAGDATGQDVNGFYVVMANGVKYDPGAASGS